MEMSHPSRSAPTIHGDLITVDTMKTPHVDATMAMEITTIAARVTVCIHAMISLNLYM